MSYENKGSMASTIRVSLEPDRSGNFVCNGTADDVEIQAAINYVGLMGGGLVHIGECPIGVTSYDIAATITDGGYSNIIIEGEGHNTVLRAANGLDNRVIFVTSADDWTLRDFKIDGNKANQTAFNSNGVQFSVADRVIMERLWVTSCFEIGIYTNSCNDVLVKDCIIDNCGADGIDAATDAQAPDAGNVIFEGNIVSESSDNGIHMGGLSNGIICNNVSHHNDNNDSPWGLNNHCGIRVEASVDGGGAQYISVIGNTVHHQDTSDGEGIYIAGDGVNGDCYDVLVSDNKLHDGGQGIYCDFVNLLQIYNNTIENYAARGIHLATANVTEWTVQGNHVIDTVTAGIYAASCTNGVVADNKVRNTAGNGIHLGSGAGLDTLVSGNHVYLTTGATKHGIAIFGGQRCFVKGNQIGLVTGSGIYVNYPDGPNYIDGNFIWDSDAYGILLDNGCDAQVVYGNFTVGNDTACMGLGNANCDDNIIWNNNFDEGNITDGGTGTIAFNNFDPSAGTWIASIGILPITNSTILVFGVIGNVTVNQTNYPVPGSGTWAEAATELQLPLTRGGTLRNLYVYALTGPGAGEVDAITVNRNAGATAITCTITGAGAQAGNDVANSQACAAGDRVSIEYAADATACATANVVITVEYCFSQP